MLRFFFWFLLLANGLLFAFHQGYIDTLVPTGREPERAANQLNANKIKLVSPAAVRAAAVVPAPQPAAALVEKKQNLVACTEVGNFNIAEARQFETRLVALVPAARISRRDIQEISSHMIFIPPQRGKYGADRKAAELRKLGITDFYVIQDGSEQRWGISLGIFKTEEAAQAHLAALNQQGIRGARLLEHKVPLNKIAFQVRELDPGTKGNIEKLKVDFPRQEMRNCE
jgi:hypothetical protein